MVTNADITIFNKVIDPVTRNEKLISAKIKNVLYAEVHGSNIIKSGLETADAVKIYIPFSSIKAASKLAVHRNDLTDTETQFVIDRGSIIIRGLVDATETATVKQLEQAYNNVHMITTVDIHDYGSPELHLIEVGCK